MFDFLFGITSRRQKTEVLRSIIESIPSDIYSKNLYTASIEILSDSEFEEFYTQITSSIVSESGSIVSESESQKKLTIQPFKLPGINSI